jgi:CRISPR-associated protein Cas1
MPVLYVTEMDAVLRKDHEVLVVSRGGETLARVPLPQVEQVVLLGPVSISTQVLTHFLVNGIECVFCSAEGKYYGRLVAGESSFGALRIAQLEHISNSGRGLTMACRFALGKLRNQLTMLRRQARRRSIGPLQESVASLEALVPRLERANTLDQLRGLEGEGARAYFQALRFLLRDPMGFAVRARRPPPDPVNAMLSLGYTLLAEATRSAVCAADLDPFLGYYHSVERSRPSLALDLMEEFRPIIVDSVVLRLVNTGTIKRSHF